MERPILFSTPMVQAILDGRKTQTRRIIKKQPHGAGEWVMRGISWLFPNVNPYVKIKCPYGQPGDVLWVRETWAKTGDNFHDDWPGHGDYYYKADDPYSEMELNSPTKGIPKWRPSIFMPKYACRIRLLVEDVRVERLQDISEEDAIAEGVGVGFQMNGGWPDYEHIENGICTVTQDTARMSYWSLWDSINGKGSWDKNPWVWVIEFKKFDTKK